MPSRGTLGRREQPAPTAGMRSAERSASVDVVAGLLQRPGGLRLRHRGCADRQSRADKVATRGRSKPQTRESVGGGSSKLSITRRSRLHVNFVLTPTLSLLGLGRRQCGRPEIDSLTLCSCACLTPCRSGNSVRTTQPHAHKRVLFGPRVFHVHSNSMGGETDADRAFLTPAAIH